MNKTTEILCCTHPYPPHNLLGNLICFKRQLVNTCLLHGINPSDDHMKATKTCQNVCTQLQGLEDHHSRPSLYSG